MLNNPNSYLSPYENRSPWTDNAISSLCYYEETILPPLPSSQGSLDADSCHASSFQNKHPKTETRPLPPNPQPSRFLRKAFFCPDDSTEPAQPVLGKSSSSSQRSTVNTKSWRRKAQPPKSRDQPGTADLHCLPNSKTFLLSFVPSYTARTGRQSLGRYRRQGWGRGPAGSGYRNGDGDEDRDGAGLGCRPPGPTLSTVTAPPGPCTSKATGSSPAPASGWW